MSGVKFKPYVKQFLPLLRDLGYWYERRDSGGHYVFAHETEDNFTLPGTPSDPRAFANDSAKLKARHPEAFERRKSENRPSKSARQARAKRRDARRPVALALVAAEPVRETPQTVGVPNAGSPEAVAAGCECPPFQNRHGLGIEGRDGIFAEVKHCPLHGWEDAPKLAAVDVARCVCGNPLPKRSGPGRPRKFCESCRPSRWKRMGEEQRRRTREHVLAWRRRQTRQEAA